MLRCVAEQDGECNNIRNPYKRFKPVQESVPEECNLHAPQLSLFFKHCSDSPLTTSTMTAIITIPNVSSILSETAASVCPPMMQLRIKNPCEENTLRAAGIAPAYKPHEKRLWTMPLIPSFGPKTELRSVNKTNAMEIRFSYKNAGKAQVLQEGCQCRNAKKHQL